MRLGGATCSSHFYFPATSPTHSDRRDSPRRRLSKLRRPEDIGELDLELHQIRNDEILARRENRRECGEGEMGGDTSDNEYLEGDGTEDDSAVDEGIA